MIDPTANVIRDKSLQNFLRNLNDPNTTQEEEMFNKSMLFAVGALTLADSASSAQMSSDKMSSDKMSTDHMAAGSMKMSKAQMKTMNSCKAMSHDMMMKSAKCTKMMKMHPDMMSDTGAMAPQ